VKAGKEWSPGRLVLTAREIVFALDGFDPEFSVVCRPLVENLKVKLAPFQKISSRLGGIGLH
jgi:hypothetical protein